MTDPHAQARVLAAGVPPAEAAAAFVMLHGRGAPAEDILSLADFISTPDIAFVAPEAVGHAWYPNRFVEPVERNEPWLSSALGLLGRIVARLEGEGVPADRIVLLGFSQGACLASEYVARNARRWGGMAALSGGVIGATVDPARYAGDLAGMPALFGCSDVDPHIPMQRVLESVALYGNLGAAVEERIYPGMGHTVNEDEIAWVRDLAARVAAGGG